MAKVPECQHIQDTKKKLYLLSVAMVTDFTNGYQCCWRRCWFWLPVQLQKFNLHLPAVCTKNSFRQVDFRIEPHRKKDYCAGQCKSEEQQGYTSITNNLWPHAAICSRHLNSNISKPSSTCNHTHSLSFLLWNTLHFNLKCRRFQLRGKANSLTISASKVQYDMTLNNHLQYQGRFATPHHTFGTTTVLIKTTKLLAKKQMEWASIHILCTFHWDYVFLWLAASFPAIRAERRHCQYSLKKQTKLESPNAKSYQVHPRWLWSLFRAIRITTYRAFLLCRNYEPEWMTGGNFAGAWMKLSTSLTGYIFGQRSYCN